MIEMDKLKIIPKVKFVMWIGIWLFLSTISDFKRKVFWSSKDISLYEGEPYRLHCWMTGRCPEQIIHYISYMMEELPLFKGKL